MRQRIRESLSERSMDLCCVINWGIFILYKVQHAMHGCMHFQTTHPLPSDPKRQFNSKGYRPEVANCKRQRAVVKLSCRPKGDGKLHKNIKNRNRKTEKQNTNKNTKTEKENNVLKHKLFATLRPSFVELVALAMSKGQLRVGSMIWVSTTRCRGVQRVPTAINGFNVVKRVVRMREDLHRISTGYLLDTNKSTRERKLIGSRHPT